MSSFLVNRVLGMLAGRRRAKNHVTVSASVCSLEQRQLLTTVNMSDHEQLMLELINRARANPEAEATRLGIALNKDLAPGTISNVPKQPLAPHQSLVNAAVSHTLDMLNRDYFAHETKDTVKLGGDRAVEAGYPAPRNQVGENLSWSGSEGPIDVNQMVSNLHRDLFDSKLHRQNMMHIPYEEIGVGFRDGVFTQNRTNFNAAMVTVNLGIRNVNPFITGVVYSDANNNDFYDIGESIRAGTVTATDVNSGATFSETIGVSGAYGISVPAGIYSVRAQYAVNGTTTSSSRIVTVGTDNVKVDFDSTSPSSLGLTASSVVTSINESGATATTTVTVTRNGSIDFPLTINLSSSDTTEATVPGTIVIPAGQTAATFVVQAVNDNVIDGQQTSRILAAAAGYTSGSVSVNVSDRTVPLLPTGDQVVPTARPSISWSSISNAASYEIWINNFTTGAAKVVNVAGLTSTSFVPSVDLGIGTYNVWVRGFTSTGQSSNWSPVGVWKTRPVTEILNSGSTQNSGAFRITWNPIPGASSYDLWVDRLTSQTSQYLRNSSVTGTALSVENFAIGRYGIWVRGRNSRGDLVPWSSQAIMTVNIPVSGVRVTADTLNGLSTLNWDAVTGATTYDVWVDNLTTRVAQVVRNISVAGTNLAMPNLTAGSYRAWVRAKDSRGANYTWSQAFDFEFQRASRMLTPPNSPQVPQPLFSWTAVSGAIRYELVIADASLVPVITESQLTNTFYTPGQTLAAGSYRAWITAFDGGGNSTAQSVAISFSVAQSDSPQSHNADLTLALAFEEAGEWLHSALPAISDPPLYPRRENSERTGSPPQQSQSKVTPPANQSAGFRNLQFCVEQSDAVSSDNLQLLPTTFRAEESESKQNVFFVAVAAMHDKGSFLNHQLRRSERTIGRES